MNDAVVVLASELQAGNYVCLRTRGILPAIIRICTRSQFNHAVLVTGPGEVVQATLRGVKASSLSEFAGLLAVANSAERVWSNDRAAIVAKGLSLVRDEYAYALLPVILLRLLGWKWGRLLSACERAEGKAVICSELVAEAGRAGNRDWLCGEAGPATVRPDELAKRAPYMRPVAWDLP